MTARSLITDEEWKAERLQAERDAILTDRDPFNILGRDNT